MFRTRADSGSPAQTLLLHRANVLAPEHCLHVENLEGISLREVTLRERPFSVGNPAYRRDLAKLSLQLFPRLASVIAAVQIAEAAAGENHVTVGRVRAKSPHTGVG